MQRMSEPGLDLHEWETRWQELQEEIADSPEQAISEVDRLLEQMLVARGFQIDEPVTAEGEDPDIIRQFLAARDVARRAEEGEADLDEIEDAIAGYRDIYEYLIEDRAPP
jgi:hypothetical protein